MDVADLHVPASGRKIEVELPGHGDNDIHLAQVASVRKTAVIVSETVVAPVIGGLPSALELCLIMNRICFLRAYDLEIIEDLFRFFRSGCLDLAVQLNGRDLNITRLDRYRAVLGGEGKRASRVHVEGFLPVVFELFAVDHRRGERHPPTKDTC